jgi:hypothetical protein
MVLSGGWLVLVLVILSLWFAFLCWSLWKLLKSLKLHQPAVRNRLSVAGIAFSTVAVGSLLALHLSWVSPAISQYFGVTTIKVLSIFLYGPSLAGLLLSALGSGRMRFLGIATTVLTGLWWFSLYMVAAISMGAPLARHPTEFLVPQGYVGWASVRFGDKDANELEVRDGSRICKIPDVGLLRTSSPTEEGWARDKYFYYSQDGTLHELRSTGWGAGGMIWGGSNERKQPAEGTSLTQVTQYFYVGTEEQYHRAVSRSEIRPFNESKSIQEKP